MALTVENRDSNFESHSDEQRDLETTIDSLGLPAEQAESLKNSLQNSEATEEQIQAFLDSMLNADPETQEAAVLYLEQKPEASLDVATTTVQIMSGDAEAIELLAASPAAFTLMAQIAEQDPEAQEEAMELLKELLQDDRQATIDSLTNLAALLTVMNGGTLKSATQDSIMNDYANAPSPIDNVLFCALRIGNYQFAKELIKKGADPNRRLTCKHRFFTQSEYQTNFHILSQALHPGGLDPQEIKPSRIVDFLEFVKEQGVTLTDDLLVMSGKLEVLEYLLSNGLNVNAVIEKSERRQATVLTGADNFRLLEYLLNSGADPNILVMRGYWIRANFQF